jgi:hypothetical protein
MLAVCTIHERVVCTHYALKKTKTNSRIGSRVCMVMYDVCMRISSRLSERWS